MKKGRSMPMFYCRCIDADALLIRAEKQIMSSSSSSNINNNWMQERMNTALELRRRKGTLRRLLLTSASSHHDAIIDFSSNDYLGLAHSIAQKKLVKSKEGELESSSASLGATGSRLLSGDSAVFHTLEQHLAGIHGRPAAVLCNSGYDANLSVVSCLPCDAILYDEYVHNSLHMGMRLWQSNNTSNAHHAQHQSQHHQRRQQCCIPFQHNNVQDLRHKLLQENNSKRQQRIAVLIESVYSMDGDVAPVVEMLDVAQQFGAVVVVDEAHGLGVYGKNGTGVLAQHNCQNHAALLFSIFTFGKAAGCHGAVVCCTSDISKQYLINYAYPLIYSTALPSHSLLVIRCAYGTITGVVGDRLRKHVKKLVEQFQRELQPALSAAAAANYRRAGAVRLLPSTSPIQALMIPGNDACTRFCNDLFLRSNKTIKLYPIKSPTVAIGQERVRIILHAHNTADQVSLLVNLILNTLKNQYQQRHRSKL